MSGKGLWHNIRMKRKAGKPKAKPGDKGYPGPGAFDRAKEDINVPINVGDTVKGGKFKNKSIKVKSIGKNDKGDITINDKPLMKFRLTTKVEARDYKDEYKKFQSSKEKIAYRADLVKYNRDKGTYGNGDGKDASHKGDKIVGFEDASKNRGRKEKSRKKGYKELRKEQVDDHEVSMARGELQVTADRSLKLVSYLQGKSDEGNPIEAWVQSKITKAKDYITSVHDYLLNRPEDAMEQAPNTADAMKRHKAGKSGFTDKAHLKAKGLIPRSDGEKRKSDKYK
tara:strand:+ start:386 stop:1231 length:846 start_codon:yes stop_codon:yes gene_type:complete